MDQIDFIKTELPFSDNLFAELSSNIEFENTGKGRLGNILVDVNNSSIPLVRSTARFNIPAHNFLNVHHRIINLVNDKLQKNSKIDFNNALIEIYDSSYKKMQYHSDHSLDLAENSFIGLFSCYENPNQLEENHIRKLKVRNKTTGNESDILLTHNSFVLFSLQTNSEFQHKIILDSKTQPITENRWLGITFRTSKTFIQFKDGLPYLSNGVELKLANKNQRKAFYTMRMKENESTDFLYPKIDFTISNADTIFPK